MKITKTDFNGLCILEPKVFGDARGYLMETYNQRDLQQAGIDFKFVQDNQSKSGKGVLRGLHYQNAPYAQTKLVRVLSGIILDIVLDLRREQITFGRTFSIELSEDNKKQLLIPKGFAHGFLVLSEGAEVLYKSDEFYYPEAEGGINFVDPELKIGTLPLQDLILSDKDRKLLRFSEAQFKF